MKQLTCFVLMLLFALNVSPLYSQPYQYTKTVLFSLEWGDEDQQIGYRAGEPSDIFPKIGATNYTVTLNGFIWIYDIVQNSIKAFNMDGKLIKKYVLHEHAGIEGFITSDNMNNIWFHDAWNHRVLKLNENGDLLYTITYDSDSVWGQISIINEKPVMDVMVMLDDKVKLLDVGFENKPEYKAQLVDVDSSSIYNINRGEFSNRVYFINDLDVSDEGDIILPKLHIDNELVDKIEFEEFITKKYYIFFQEEDQYCNYYLYLFPHYQEDISPYIYKYNINNELVSIIELPWISQKYGFASYPLFINDNGDVYYMELRDEAITFYKWSALEGE